MGQGPDKDFATLLDELIAESVEAERDVGPAQPSLQVDLLAQIERLQAENIALFPERAVHEYVENSEAPPRVEATPVVEPDPTSPDLQPALDDLFFLDPQTISRELGIKPRSRPDELDRARRAFALRYHPDRVPEAFRERAALRMQIANMLIDEAKRAAR